jgi:hypothetical protein
MQLHEPKVSSKKDWRSWEPLSETVAVVLLALLAFFLIA